MSRSDEKIAEIRSERNAAVNLSRRQRAAIARQAEAIARLRADAERLDWLEEMANEPGGLLLHDGSETGRRGIGLRPGHMARMLRAAIDSARAKAQP